MNQDIKKYIELVTIDFKQHMTDLKNAFSSDLKGIGDYVRAIDEKVTNIEKGVTDMDHKMNNMQNDIFFMKGELQNKVDKADLLELNRRLAKAGY